jgi:hypothetical protein
VFGHLHVSFYYLHHLTTNLKKQQSRHSSLHDFPAPNTQGKHTLHNHDILRDQQARYSQQIVLDQTTHEMEFAYV